MIIIGQGTFILKDSDEPSVSRLIRYTITETGIELYDPPTNSQSHRLFDFLQTLTPEQTLDAGQLSLVSLPASPQAAFYNVSLTPNSYDPSANAVTLMLTQAEKFAFRSNTFFKDLTITFTESREGGALTIEGVVTLCLFGLSDINITLEPHLTAEGLAFKTAGPQSFDIQSLGRLTITALEVGRNAQIWDDLQALYSFTEPTGDVFGDSSGSAAPAIDLQSTGPSQAIQRIPGGISLGDSTADPRHSTVLESSKEAAKKISTACKLSNALTISAWIKPTRKFTEADRQLPARIISLSKDESERNFTLGQDIHKNEHDNRYVVRVRRENSNSQGVPPLFSKPVPSLTDELTYVVFTREATPGVQSAKLYINGEDQTDREISGDLSGAFRGEQVGNSGNFRGGWSDDYALLLGNEKTRNRAWDGEIHQAAIYSRALSPQEIRNNYVPAFKTLTALLELRNVPVPFKDTRLPVTVNLETNQLLVEQQGLVASPFLRFDQVSFTWSAHQSDTGSQWVSGSVEATLWGNSINFDMALTANELTLSRVGTQQKTLVLNDIAPLPPLGEIKLRTLTLRAERSANQPNWIVETDGQVSFAVIPPPLKGPFPVALSLEDEKLWFSINPEAPLILVEELQFAQANLHFIRDDSDRDNYGWQVHPDSLQGDRGDISLLLFGEARSLSAELVPIDGVKSLSLIWQRPLSSANPTPSETLFGKLNLSSFSLIGHPILGNDLFWQIEILGQVPLLLEAGLQASVLEFSTKNGKILGDPARVQPPIRLTGESQLQSLEDTIFEGDLGLNRQTFSLNGRFNLFPVWSALQVEGDARIDIEADGQLTSKAPVQVTMPDFELREPELTLGDQQLTLSGVWLGQPASFKSLHRANQSIWEGSVHFNMPFSLSLGPLYQPGSQVKLADQIRVCQTPNCRQIMNLDLVVELSSAGFLARVKSTFPWQDETNTIHILEPAVFQLLTLPTSRNAILGEVIQRVKAQGDELFSPYFKPAYGYFFAERDRQPPLLYLGDVNSSGAQAHITTLPPLFTVAAGSSPVSITVASFKLEEQPDRSCQLTISPGTGEPGTISPDNRENLQSQYNAFIAQLDGQPRLMPGALTLVKTRVAQRLPSLVDESLYYYYGFTPAEGMIDLQAGMRLRVEYQNYQFVHPIDKTAEAGFVSSGMAYYSLQFDAAENFLSFDPFLSSVPVALEGENQGVSGLIDLFRAGYRKPFYRLIYPDEFLVTSGRIASERLAVLVGADDINTLTLASHYFKKPSSASNAPPGNIAVAYFRGRATVVPEIAIFVQEQPEYVPVGTTLRQLSQRYGQAALKGRLQRLVHEGVSNLPNYHFVDLGNDAVALDLPLVQGDRVHF